MNILVFAPHPDDDVLGCGGSIIKHTQKGDEVTVIYLTNGDAGDLRYSKEKMAAIRKKEAKEAGIVMGIKASVFLNLHDGYIEYATKIVFRIVEIIRKLQPDSIYLPHKNESHRDHTNTYTIVFEAIRRAGANSYQEVKRQPWNTSTVLCYEVWTPFQHIQYAEDITEVMEIKMQAIAKHVSQLENLDYADAIKGLNRYRGVMLNKGFYCECFEIIKTSLG